MANSRQVGGLVGPTLVAVLVSEFPLVQPGLYDDQILPVVYLSGDDIAEIWEHSADDSLRAADRWIDQSDEQLSLLATQSLMGRARDELAPDLRSCPFGRCAIFNERSLRPLPSRWTQAAAGPA